MTSSEHADRDEIVEVGQWMHRQGWVAANDGNISRRVGHNLFLCTPTGVSKGLLRPSDLIVVDQSGQRVAGEAEPTSEIAMHLTIYAARPDIAAVVHAHPCVATGFAAAGRALDVAILPEVIVGFGTIPLTPYGLPGTPALSEQIAPYLADYDALLLQNHGVVTYGKDLLAAYHRMETVEHVAKITLVTELLGGAQPLGKLAVTELLAARTRYGVRPELGLAHGGPLSAEDLVAHQSANGK